ncbi:S-layer-like protein [Candidatus Mancarchaeum acidiphilum]|uniref:S-layer-like protein n=1 Tax=Candidatus Mancarchaeum acidiphilum TaxID=1920749 RepID=A0A218NLY1_9ARCH|nr:S-layer protein [Candidatus Mancarchaeum acidiphilum]ASI13477.1 S-layer-like protein [Candidatus Mancarchaeum acidiphilum]
MKHINAKRVAAVAVGTALLGMGLAFAVPVSFQSVPIVSSAGQPVVQIALGYNGTYPASITDGVAAADIAAAIGNLAYTTTPVTVNINASQARSVLKPVVTSSAYKLTDQQVWLNESSSAYVSGSYSFGALIGSVFNRGIKLNTLSATKTVGTVDAYPTTYNLTASPTASPYTATGFVPVSTSVSASTNGGGVSFSSFLNGTDANIMRVTSTNLPSLLSNYGANGENEYLWLTGFPVYDQANSSFALVNAGGAYQINFNKPIPAYTSSNSINHASIMFLGKNWTIANYTLPSGTVSSSTYTTGGKLELASAVSPITTLYLDHFLNSTPFGVELSGFTEPNSSGISQPIYHVFYNGTLVNSTTIKIGTTKLFNVSGHKIYVYVKSAAADVFESASYAKTQLYTNVYNITDGAQLNKTSAPGWYTDILWTNSSTSGTPNELEGIVAYNSTPTTLYPGQSFSFISDPAIWKLDFEGSSLASGDYDHVTSTLTSVSNIKYSNKGAAALETNITEPGQELSVSSSISNAFSFDGQINSTVNYLLTPYELNDTAHTAPANTAAEVSISSPGNYISATNPLSVVLTGYLSSSAVSPTSASVTFNSVSGNVIAPLDFYNLTSIEPQRAIPGMEITAMAGSNTIGVLAPIPTAQILLTPVSGSSVYGLGSAGSVTYSQQNGQPTTTFALSGSQDSNTMHGTQTAYYTYTMNEYDVPSSTNYNDSLSYAILNSSAGADATPLFQLNYSSSATGYSHNNMTYLSSQKNSVKAPAGFVTERGSKVASIAPESAVVDMATSVGELNFYVAPTNVTAVVSHAKTYGPYSIGEATNIPNVTIANVSAKISVSNANYTISGISNLSSAVTTTPSVADVPTNIENMTMPGSPSGLVILDTQAAPTSSLILVGSGYVNTLSAQLQKAYNISVTPTSAPIVKAYPSSATVGGPRILVAGYNASQTMSAAKTFIEDLYANAAKS